MPMILCYFYKGYLAKANTHYFIIQQLKLLAIENIQDKLRRSGFFVLL
jgi:hypothetical protein